MDQPKVKGCKKQVFKFVHPVLNCESVDAGHKIRMDIINLFTCRGHNFFQHGGNIKENAVNALQKLRQRQKEVVLNCATRRYN